MEVLPWILVLCLVGVGSSQGVLHTNGKNIDTSQIKFLLWTRSHPEDLKFEVLGNGNSTLLQESSFDGSLKTYFLFHGYTDIGTKLWILSAKTNLLFLEPCNVISVEYGKLVLSPDYATAVSNMYDVAAYTASMIDWLAEEAGLSAARTHITGHSLGAHAAGMTAKSVVSGRIDRITGLDPAGPLFYNKGSDQRLDKSQATFVDVIHTNGCSLLKRCQGISEPLGHIDFYPSGGENQNGCIEQPEFKLLGNDVGSCSHQIVTTFWTESMLAGLNGSLTFASWPCDSWDTFIAGGCPDCGQGCVEMGFHAQRNLEGTYYLSTKDSSPYAMGYQQV